MSDKGLVLVTGATGFVGSVLCGALADAGYRVRAALRRPSPVPVAETTVVGDIGAATSWHEALRGVTHVVHLAARVHMMHDTPENARLYTETNVRGTEVLAEAAARAGVARFVFLSSVKVNGEETSGRGYTAEDSPHPGDAYGISKWEAEQSLLALATRLPVAIVRPPLVYGPGVRANFLRLLRWVDKGVPLPLGAVRNRRSLVSVWNLADLIIAAMELPTAVGRTWMVSDNHDLSTPDLIRGIASAMNRSARLLPVPPSLLVGLASLAGKGAEAHRLCGSLAVDISRTVADLGWSPRVSLDEGLGRTVRWYQTHG